MIAPVPDHRLIDDLTAQIGVVEKLPHTCERDAESVATEVAWLKALAHMAKRNGLTHAGREEARKILAASKDWVKEYLGEEAVRGR